MIKRQPHQGDKGITSNFQGDKIAKDSCYVEVLGDLDEANSFLGLANTFIKNPETQKTINQVQSNLFLIGSVIAGAKSKLPAKLIIKLEKEIKVYQKNLPILKSFIIPGGSTESSFIHVARSLTRRVERKVYQYLKTEKTIDKNVLVYLNRLSLFLFILARFLNYQKQIKEEEWKSGN